MKLSYFELLSPDPVHLPKVGGILSPKLKDISSIGINTYQFYLSILLMDLNTYFRQIGQEEAFNALSDEEKAQMNMYDLLTSDEQPITLLQKALNFFIREDVVYSTQHKSFLVNDKFYVEENGEVVEKYGTVGVITKDIYPQICDVICQRNFVKSNQSEDLSNVKSKKAQEIMKKLQKGRCKKTKQTKSDQNMELGNVISAVANRSHSLNIINIWDLTVYQVWDCFSRLSNNSIYDIQAMSVAAWGDKDKHFDAAAWFKKI